MNIVHNIKKYWQILWPCNSLRQASLSRVTKQLMPTQRGRRPPPTQGGGSGLSYHVFRGAMTLRCLASGGVRLRRQGTGREGRAPGGGGGRREDKIRCWVAVRPVPVVGRRKGKKGRGEGMLNGSCWASTCVLATTSTVSPLSQALTR